MASNKEALALVLDVGPAMCQGPEGESNYFEQSITAIDMILQRKLFSESKDEVALILFGTPETANDLSSEDSYSNITVAKPLGPVNWDLLQYVENDLKPGNMSADFLDAIVVAMDHLYKSVQGKKGFASKRVVLFSNVAHEFGDDQLNDIIGAMKEAEIEFDVIGPNLDEEDGDKSSQSNGANGGTKKPKTAQQVTGEALLRHIVNSEFVEASSFSFREALHMLSHFQSRQVRSTAWKCLMEIGTSLKIPICLYTRIKEAKPKSFKNVYAKDTDAETERLRTSHLNDDAETEVEKTELVDGHRYGSTLVPFSEEDKAAMKYETEKCFKVLGFTKSENVKRHQVMGDSTWVCVADKDDESSVAAVSSLISALYETNMVAIVRRVYAKNGAVKLGCLMPVIKSDYECLYFVELPFAEDVRQFTFGSLPVDEAEASMPNHKFAPSEEQLTAVDELIDSMDLSNADRDVSGEKTEAIKPKLTFNPYLQRLYQCLKHRALSPDDALPELSPIVAASLNPPAVVAVSAKPALEKVKEVFKLEPVAKKEAVTGDAVFKASEANGEPDAKKAKRSDESSAAEVSAAGGLADIIKPKVTEISTATPVEDFEALLADPGHLSTADVHGMLQRCTTDLILKSFRDQSYPKAVACIQALRREAVKKGNTKLFNSYLRELKDTLVSKGQTNFWKELHGAKLSLISKEECSADEENTVTSDDAHAFLELKVEEAAKPAEEPAADASDLLDELQ